MKLAASGLRLLMVIAGLGVGCNGKKVAPSYTADRVRELESEMKAAEATSREWVSVVDSLSQHANEGDFIAKGSFIWSEFEAVLDDKRARPIYDSKFLAEAPRGPG